MNATFLVTLNLDDVSMVQQIAEDIDNDLMDSGYEVVEVKPWARPTLNIATSEPTTFGGIEPPSLF